MVPFISIQFIRKACEGRRGKREVFTTHAHTHTCACALCFLLHVDTIGLPLGDTKPFDDAECSPDADEREFAALEVVQDVPLTGLLLFPRYHPHEEAIHVAEAAVR